MHGTHVAGSIVARDQDPFGLGGTGHGALGVAPNAYMFAYRVFSPGSTAAIILTAFEWLLFDRPDVVNMSFGGGGQGPTYASAIAMTNIALQEPYMVLINSAGNSGIGWYSNTNPAGSPAIISVGAYQADYHGGFYASIPGIAEPVLARSSVMNIEVIWEQLPNGNFASNTEFGVITRAPMNHVDGEFTVFPMPSVHINTPPSDGRAELGRGEHPDFARLVDMYPHSIGNYVMVRRGDIPLMNVARNALEWGFRGVISVGALPSEALPNGSGALTAPFIASEFASAPLFIVDYEVGMQLMDNMRANAIGDQVFGTTTFSFVEESHNHPHIVTNFSSRGPIMTTFEIKPDITSHGFNVISPVPPIWAGLGAGNYAHAYAPSAGTSMSAPHVAGGAALMVQYSRENHERLGISPMGWTAAEIRVRMMNTANEFPGDWSVFDGGPGYLHVYNAIMADTVVHVEFDRTPHVYGESFLSQRDRWATIHTGSFSFGGGLLVAGQTDANGIPIDATFRGSMRSVINNQSNEARTYRISYEWNVIDTSMGGRLAVVVQDQADFAAITIHTSISIPGGGGYMAGTILPGGLITVPARSSVAYFVNLTIDEDAPFGFIEGAIIVERVDNNARVARLPFAFVSQPIALSESHILRNVLNTNDATASSHYGQQIELVYTPNLGHRLTTYIFERSPMTLGEAYPFIAINHTNWREWRFRPYLIGMAPGRVMVQEQAVMQIGNVPMRMAIIDGTYAYGPNIHGVQGDPAMPGFSSQESDEGRGRLEEGRYIGVIAVARETQFLWLLPGLIGFPIFNYMDVDPDIVFDFYVNNTPAVIYTNDVSRDFVNGQWQVSLSGNIFSEWTNYASTAGVTFDIWRDPARAAANAANTLRAWV
jgi:subtilisin family serine protease